MNLNSINYQSVDDQYDPGYLPEHESVYQPLNDDDNMDLYKLMLLKVYSMLDVYDNSPNNVAKVNPYQDKLYLTFDNDQQIEIPNGVVQTAITQWQKLNNKKSVTNKNKVNEDNSDFTDMLFQFLMCLLIVFTLMYTYSLFKRGTIRFR